MLSCFVRSCKLLLTLLWLPWSWGSCWVQTAAVIQESNMWWHAMRHDDKQHPLTHDVMQHVDMWQYGLTHGDKQNMTCWHAVMQYASIPWDVTSQRVHQCDNVQYINMQHLTTWPYVTTVMCQHTWTCHTYEHTLTCNNHEDTTCISIPHQYTASIYHMSMWHTSTRTCRVKSSGVSAHMWA